VRVTDEGVPVAELIESVKRAIKTANLSSTDTGRDLHVTSLHLILHAIATRSLGGSLQFCIPFTGMTLSLGKKVTRQDTHRIEIGLAPPGPEEHEIRADDIESALADAIATIRATMASAAGSDDPFTLTDSSIEPSFAVTEEGDITLGVDVGLSDELTHTLTLKLEPVKGDKRLPASTACQSRRRCACGLQDGGVQARRHLARSIWSSRLSAVRPSLLGCSTNHAPHSAPKGMAQSVGAVGLAPGACAI
jgi:hypothetical protein